MASSVQGPSSLRELTGRFSHSSPENSRQIGGKRVSPRGITALSIEFVAKPQAASSAQSDISSAIASTFQGVTGFAGCLVMASDQEARLVTVLTLWAGDDRFERCGNHTRWVHKLLSPYIDRCLRVRTLVTNLQVPPKPDREMATMNGCSILQALAAQGEEVCVA